MSAPPGLAAHYNADGELSPGVTAAATETAENGNSGDESASGDEEVPLVLDPVLAPDLPAPLAFIFRGFVAESASGQASTSFFPTAIPARLKATAGFVRSVDYHTAGLQTLIGVRRVRTDLGEQAGTINGVIQVCRDPIGRFDRDEYIELVPRPVSDFEAISWLSLPPYIKRIYVQSAADHRIWRASVAEPVLQTYLDQQIVRCQNVARAASDDEHLFAREFIDTTRNWPKFWLNDREVPRRPWLHIQRAQPTDSGNAQVKLVDSILKQHPAAPNNMFVHRKLQVEYAVLIEKTCTENHIDPAYSHACSRPPLEMGPPLQTHNSTDWTGTTLPTAKVKHFMFGFGSLMNSKSRTASDPSATAAVPVRVSAKAGFARAWNFQHPTAAITALGVCKCADGKGQPINGVCTPIYTNDADGNNDQDEVHLPQEILDREVGYTPYSIPSCLCHPLGWATLPPGSKVWLFVPDSPVEGGDPGTGLDFASPSHPILQTYVDICVLGCLEYSREFAVEFITSTVGWDGPWLNDREVPRRPWVHQPQYRKVDRLLREVIRKPFERRMLPEEFGAMLMRHEKMTRQKVLAKKKKLQAISTASPLPTTRIKAKHVKKLAGGPTSGQWYEQQDHWKPWTDADQREALEKGNHASEIESYKAWKQSHSSELHKAEPAGATATGSNDAATTKVEASGTSPGNAGEGPPSEESSTPRPEPSQRRANVGSDSAKESAAAGAATSVTAARKGKESVILTYTLNY